MIVLKELVKELNDVSRLRDVLEEKLFVGIDFGTSTSVVSYIYFDKSINDIGIKQIEFDYILKNGDTNKSHLIPSVLYYSQSKDQLYIGESAKNRRFEPDAKEGETYFSSFKINLGANRGNEFTKTVLKVNHNRGTVRNHKEASSLFIGNLVQKIKSFAKENNLPSDIYYSVSIPASFESNQRKDLMDILKDDLKLYFQDGLFIDEPNAAFLSYLETTKETLKIGSRQHTLVFDYGAGTCDISILELQKTDKGFSSKNRAISKFAEFGGDNIDRVIAKDYLFPQFCEEVGLDRKIISTNEYIDYFQGRLKSVAENLKIKISKKLKTKISLQNTENSVTEGDGIVISYKENKYECDSLDLTYADFHKVMTKFVSSKYRNGEESIFYGVNDALSKSNLDKDQVDNILLIGGSCNNTYIQNALNEAFPNSIIIIPEDLQSHVSRGTAMNSLLLNGLNASPLEPVISESISIKTSNGFKTLLAAGNSIPMKRMLDDDFNVQLEGQEYFELPIYVSGEDKIVSKNRIKASNGSFSTADKIQIIVEITRDKIIVVSLICNNLPLQTISVKPYSNKVLTPYRAKEKELQRQLNDYASSEDSYNTRKIADQLVELHSKNGSHRDAMEVLIRYKPHAYTNIGYHASHAGERDICKNYQELAYKNDRSGVSAYNLALEFSTGSEKWIKYMKESVEMDYMSAKLVYGKYLKDNENTNEEGFKFLTEAFNSFYSNFKRNPKGLAAWEYNQLKNAATYLGKIDVKSDVERIQKELREENEKSNELYKDKYLLSCEKDDRLTAI